MSGRAPSAGAAAIAGVVLAGGSGTRLGPLTEVTNKHLLPVGGEPLVTWAIRQLVTAGVADVLLVIDQRHASEFMATLRDGRGLGLRSLAYVWQPPGGLGMPTAIGMAEHLLRTDKFVVACGDVLTETDLRPVVGDFARQRHGARMVAVQAEDSAGFSRLRVRDGIVLDILDKDRDQHVPSLVDLGFYFYHGDVFAEIRQLVPSARGETEIWELNRAFARRGCLLFSEVSGWWADAGGGPEIYADLQKRYAP